MPLANSWTIVLMDDEADIRDIMTLKCFRIQGAGS